MNDFWSGKSVLVTGHTGFKGSWLSEILLREGASVTGLALSPKASDDLFLAAKLQDRLSHNVLDIRDRVAVEDLVLDAKPDVVFHLAAQPLVLTSYKDPAYTWDTNVTGTINLLEALRKNQKICASVIVTTTRSMKTQVTRQLLMKIVNSVAMTHTAPVSATEGSCQLATFLL